jgi:hypothetical protein
MFEYLYNRRHNSDSESETDYLNRRAGEGWRLAHVFYSAPHTYYYWEKVNVDICRSFGNTIPLSSAGSKAFTTQHSCQEETIVELRRPACG